MNVNTQYEYVTLPIGSPTKNGRIYPNEVMQKAIEKYNTQFVSENTAFVTLYSEEEGTCINLLNVVGLVKKASIVDDKLVVSISFLDTDAAKKLCLGSCGFDSTKYEVTPFGIASVKDDIVQDDYDIVGFHITIKENE